MQTLFSSKPNCLVFHSILRSGDKRINQNENSMQFIFIYDDIEHVIFVDIKIYIFSVVFMKVCNNGVLNSIIQKITSNNEHLSPKFSNVVISNFNIHTSIRIWRVFLTIINGTHKVSNVCIQIPHDSTRFYEILMQFCKSHFKIQ